MSKKALALLAFAAATTPVMAQSTVTVYGLIDAYVEFGKGDHTTTSINSGGMNGSRLGFKGSEDLGGGLKAIFQLENGMAVDTGSVTQGGVFYGRQSYVGLSSDAGTLMVGRQYTPHIIHQGNYDPFEQGAGSSYNNGLVTGFFRVNNSVMYSSPTWKGFSTNVMYGLGETTGSKGNFFNFNADQTIGAGSVGLTYARQNAPATGGEALTAVMLTGAYKIDAVRLTAGLQKVRNATQALATSDNRTEAFAGAQISLGTDSLWLGGAQGKYDGQQGSTARQYSAAYLHPLSKRTTVYAAVTTIQNGDHTQYTFDNATGAGLPVSAGVNARALQLGIRHSF